MGAHAELEPMQTRKPESMTPEHEQWLTRLSQFHDEDLKPILHAELETVEILPPAPDPFRSTPTVDELRSAMMQEASSQAFCRQDHERILRGCGLIGSSLPHTAFPERCRSELLSAIAKLSHSEEASLEELKQMAQSTSEVEAAPMESDLMDAFWDDAVSVRESLGLSREVFEELYKIGLRFHHDRSIEDALCVFRCLTVLDATCQEAWLGLGTCQQELGELDNAIVALANAVAMDGLVPIGYFQLAKTMFLNGDSASVAAIIELAESNLAQLGADDDVLSQWNGYAEELRLLV